MKILMLVLSLARQDWETSFENAAPEERERAASVARLSEEVSLLNLINGLYLSREQSEKIIALAGEARRLRDRTIREHAAAVRRFEEALAELKKTLEGCGHIPAELEARVGAAEGDLNAVKREYFEKLRKLEKKVCGVLTEAQKRVVDPFNPCIIPPQELKDPVRVGQAAGPNAEIEGHLETLRNLPDTAWKPVAEALFEMLLAFEEIHLGRFAPERRRAEMKRLMALGEKVRGLSDEDFEIQKGALGLEVLEPIVKYQEKANELTAFFMSAGGGLSKTGKYLLNPRVIPLLEAKLKHICETPSADLDRVTPADSCRSCGRRTETRRTVEHPGPEPKFALLAEWLGLDSDQAAAAREALGQAQVELLTVLTAEREDGRKIFAEFIRKLIAKKEVEAFALLGERAPDGKTYIEHINAIKADAEEKLEEAMGPERMEKFRAGGIDLFKVKVGALRWKK